MSEIQNDIIGGGEKQEQAAPPPERTPEGIMASSPEPITETVEYSDGASATGVAPLPGTSPEGAPAVEPDPIPAESPVEKVVDEAIDYAALYLQEQAAHVLTKQSLTDALARLKQAADMGFRAGGGIHSGA